MKTKILVIDDDPEEFLILKKIFSRAKDESYHLDWCGQPLEARSLMLNGAYDAFLIDYVLGNTNGLELIKEAKRENFKGPVILLTSFGKRAIDDEALACGIDDYFPKEEVTYEALDRSIRYAMERRRVGAMILDQQLKMSELMRLSAIGEMAGGIAHEVNNPLATIQAVSSLVSFKLEQGSADNEFLIESVKKIEKHCARAGQIIKSLRRFIVPRNTQEFEDCSLKDLMTELQDILAIKLSKSDVTMEIDLAVGSGEIECRASEILQVLINIINNAVDALEDTENGHIKISVSERPAEYVFSICDNGPGIPEAVAQDIFKLFVTTKSSGKGTGIGLSICKMLVESHRGELFLGKPENGAEFILVLPKRQTKIMQKTNTILIADQDEDTIKLLSSLFQGHNVKTTSLGTEALKIIREEDIHVAIMSVTLPEYSGLSIYRDMVNERIIEGKKIILLTEPGSSHHLAETLRNDSINIFEKPVDIRGLIQAALS